MTRPLTAAVQHLARLATRLRAWLDPDRVLCRWVRDTDEGDD